MPDATTPTSSLVDLLFDDDLADRCLVAPDGCILRANAAWLRSAGLGEEQVVGKNIDDLFPSQRDATLVMHARARAGNRVEVPPHAQVVNGRETWREGSIAPVPTEGGTGLLITLREAVKSQAVPGSDGNAEEALRAKEADLARAQAVAHLGSWRWDLVDDTVSWSDELYRIFGVDPATFLPSNDAARGCLHPDDRDRHARYVAMALAGASVPPFESRVIRPGGEERVVLASGFDIERDAAGNPRALFGTVLDITDWDRIFAAKVEGVVVQDGSGRILSCNAAAERILGLSRAQMEGRTSVDPRWRAVHTDGRPFPGEEHPAMVTLRTGEPSRGIIMGVDAPGAGLRWISISSEPLRHAPGQSPYAVVTTFGDVTELRRGRELLEQSERRYRALFENLREEVTVFEVERDADGKVKDWILRASNGQARAFFKGRYGEMVGRRLTELGGEDMRSHVERTEAILAGNVETHPVFVQANGKHYLSTAFPIDDRTIITAAMDITARVEAELALKDALARNERTLAELRATLDQVKTLKGLLPICMHCHKIRNDEGYWKGLEQYIEERTGAAFSHSICPDCLQRHYPEG